MSGIIHSIVTLFRSPTRGDGVGSGGGRITRSRAREQQREEEENTDDDDVFSTFGDDNDENNDRMETQQDEVVGKEEEVGNDSDDGEDDEEVNTQPPVESSQDDNDQEVNDDGQQRQQEVQEEGGNQNENVQQHSESTTATEAGQSLATQQLSTSTVVVAEDNNSQVMEDGGAKEGGEAVEGSADQTNDMMDPAASSTSSPLVDFFAHIATVADGNQTGLLSLAQQQHQQLSPNDEGSMSMKDWKRARKTMLQQYLTRRLIGPEDSDAEEEQREGNGSNGDDEECSFSSDVLDEPFGTEENTMSRLNNGDAGDSEDEEDVPILETQPQIASVLQTQEEEEDMSLSMSPLKTQQEEGEMNMTPDTGRGEMAGENKRKMGGTPSDDTGEQQLPQRKRPRRDLQQQQQQPPHRGLMWDGRLESIPHVNDTFSHSCSKLEELDLSSETLDLSLCQVLRVWDVRSTKRLDRLIDSSEMVVHPSQDGANSCFPFATHCEDDGPLGTIYKRVFSMEICQLVDAEVDENNEQHPPIMSPSVANKVTNITAAAFHDGKVQLDKSLARRRRRAVRRVRLFFYNRYADIMSSAYHDVSQQMMNSTRNKKKKKKNNAGSPLLLLSLTSVPSKCILPHSIFHALSGNKKQKLITPSRARLEQYISNPFGDEELGILSPYCVCIGDRSSIRFDNNDDNDDGPSQKLYFDNEELEIRLVPAPAPVSVNRLAASPPRGNEDNIDYEGINGAAVLEDAVINAETVHGEQHEGGYVLDGRQSMLVKRYVQLAKNSETSAVQVQPVVFNLEEEEEEVTVRENANAMPDEGAASRRGRGNGTNNGNGSTTAAAPEADGRIVRPTSVVPLSNLHPLLHQNNMQRLKDPINVYGVVLGFSPPSLTRTQEWMMSIVLIDETLPLSNITATEGGINANSMANDSPKEMHVPSVTLILFSKEKSKLPVVKSAGDVLCCEKVALQVWRDEPQLCARRYSRVIVARPLLSRRPDDGQPLHDSTVAGHWCTSCSCHGSDEEHAGTLKYQLANSLWRWGQRRLSKHPTVSSNARVSIAEAGNTHHDNNNNGGGGNRLESSVSGDLTAAVTAIIPVPESLRRRDTPRGYVRLWDGTGMSQSDPLPLDDPGHSLSGGDPPEQLLVEIEKIIQALSPSLSSAQQEQHTNNNDTHSSNFHNIQAPLALCGRVINAIIWEENLWNLIHEENMIHIGSFVRLRNINSAELPGMGNNIFFSVHAKSSLTPLPFDAYEAKDLLKAHDSRIRMGDPPNPASAILPSSARLSTGGNRSGRRSNNVIEEQPSRYDNNSGAGLCNIKDCLQTSPPASFTVQFEISHTIPACDLALSPVDAIKTLCPHRVRGDSVNGTTASFRFALHVKDASSEMDILCLGRVAEELLGIKAQDFISVGNDSNDGNDKGRRKMSEEKCNAAMATIREITSPGSVCEGKIRSILGKDGKLYFILKSMFCINTAETV